MSLREMAYDIFDDLTEQQLKDFIRTFGDFGGRVPSDELLEAFAEVEEMKKHPERYKSYDSAEEMMSDILKSDDTSI